MKTILMIVIWLNGKKCQNKIQLSHKSKNFGRGAWNFSFNPTRTLLGKFSHCLLLPLLHILCFSLSPMCLSQPYLDSYKLITILRFIHLLFSENPNAEEKQFVIALLYWSCVPDSRVWVLTLLTRHYQIYPCWNFLIFTV